MLNRRSKLMTLAMLGWLPLACLNDSSRCSPGQVYQDGVCIDPNAAPPGLVPNGASGAGNVVGIGAAGAAGQEASPN